MKRYTVLVFLSLMAAGCTEQAGCRIPDTGKNVVLIIIDTLRADHLSCYGYSRETSPEMDSLARNGTVWLNAVSQAPWTLPSHASIWTGLSVKAHGTNHIGGIEGFDMKLDTRLPSLPSEVQGSGYQTSGFTNFVLLSEEFGFNIGFDHYDCEGSGTRTAEDTFDAFLAWLDNQAEEKNFFSVIHVYDVHLPYAPVPPYDTAFSAQGQRRIDGWEIADDGRILNPDDRDHLVSMYDGEILYVDDQIRRLLSEMRSRGLAENTVIIITSDHGEEFFEHGGVGHGHALFQEQLHVPLIISGPGIEAGKEVSDPVALFDIMPTVLGILNIPVPRTIEGADILSGSAGIRPIPSGGVSPDRFFLANTPLEEFQSFSILYGTDKIIASMGIDSLTGYDLAADPLELNPVLPGSSLVDMALFHWATPRLGNPEPMGERTEEINNTLRDLGYIR